MWCEKYWYQTVLWLVAAIIILEKQQWCCLMSDQLQNLNLKLYFYLTGSESSGKFLCCWRSEQLMCRKPKNQKSPALIPLRFSELLQVESVWGWRLMQSQRSAVCLGEKKCVCVCVCVCPAVRESDWVTTVCQFMENQYRASMCCCQDSFSCFISGLFSSSFLLPAVCVKVSEHSVEFSLQSTVCRSLEITNWSEETTFTTFIKMKSSLELLS